jgi:soluble lytic murein transglycosylase-like protein
MAQKLQIILMPGGAGTLKRVAIPKPLMVFGICCAVLWIGIVSYIVADYRTLRSPWRELVLLDKENAEQRETIQRMTEEIIQVAHELGDMPEYDGEGEIGERLLQAYDEVQSLLASASEQEGSQSLGPVQERYRSLIREMHASLESLDRELDSLAVLYDPRILYAVGGSPADEQGSSEALEDLETANRVLIERQLRKIARELGVAPGLALSMAKVESRFDHKAVSPKGAIGVLQVMPYVAWEEYDVPAERLFDPDVNIRVGLTFMKSLLKRFDHNVDLSLAAYNAGPTKVVEAGYQVPPIKQTQDYVKRVREAMNEYGPMTYWQD